MRGVVTTLEPGPRLPQQYARPSDVSPHVNEVGLGDVGDEGDVAHGGDVGHGDLEGDTGFRIAARALDDFGKRREHEFTERTHCRATGQRHPALGDLPVQRRHLICRPL